MDQIAQYCEKVQHLFTDKSACSTPFVKIITIQRNRWKKTGALRDEYNGERITPIHDETTFYAKRMSISFFVFFKVPIEMCLKC